MNRYPLRFILSLIAILFMPAITHAAILRVDVDSVAGAPDGSTWALAYATIKDALKDSTSGDQLWVAEGTYTESVYMNAGITIYGGFDGTETLLSQRDIETNQTLIDVSGEIAAVRYHAVWFFNVTNAVLDGFTITGGLATGADDDDDKGPGVYFYDAGNSNTLANCTITGNYADLAGGGIAIVQSSPLIADCIVNGNEADSFGGGIYITGPSSPVLSST